MKQYELIAQINTVIKTLRIHPKVFDKEEHKYLHKFFNKALFTSLNQLDLAIGLKHLDINQALNNYHEANYFARIVILTSHEILNDLNKMIGKDIRMELINKIEKELLNKLDLTTKNLSSLKKKHLKYLKTLRNKVVAHKDPDSLNQTNIMVEINNIEVYETGNDIFNSLMPFTNSYTKIIRNI